MRKSTITKTWLSGMVAIAVGGAATAVAVGLMLGYGGTFTQAPSGTGYDFVPRLDAFFWTLTTVLVVAVAIGAAGAIVQSVAWIMALVNSYRLPGKAWFAINLVLGLLGFGLISMIVYLLAAPDGYEYRPQTTPIRPAALAPTS
jgi:hypothetical protein